MGACLTQELVERYTTGDCLAEERLVIETHLAECESCRQQIESSKSNVGEPYKPASADNYKTVTDASIEKTAVLQDDLPTKAIPDETGFKTISHSLR